MFKIKEVSDLDNLRREEKIIFDLRKIYEQFGYKHYKMKKFEQYDLYQENKSFLSSEHIITFNDLNGKLLALKPDVTLSIVKNANLSDDEILKLYYNENVYRTSNREFKEIMQVGLEFIGKLDLYSLYEVVCLAKKSLEAVSENYILEISHMGFILGILESEEISYGLRENLLKCISEKNVCEIEKICKDASCSSEYVERVKKLTALGGSFSDVLNSAETLVCNTKTQDAVNELKQLYNTFVSLGEENNISLDFSVVNDMSYYNGIVFNGYIENIPYSVLSGGRYDNLLRKFNKDVDAIGFAVYVDVITSYITEKNEYDTDIVIIYENADVSALLKAIQMFTQSGQSVRVQQAVPKDIKYKQLLKFTERGLEIIEKND